MSRLNVFLDALNDEETIRTADATEEQMFTPEDIADPTCAAASALLLMSLLAQNLNSNEIEVAMSEITDKAIFLQTQFERISKAQREQEAFDEAAVDLEDAANALTIGEISLTDALTHIKSALDRLQPFVD